jgi:hypothetical protein
VYRRFGFQDGRYSNQVLFQAQIIRVILERLFDVCRWWILDACAGYGVDLIMTCCTTSSIYSSATPSHVQLPPQLCHTVVEPVDVNRH